MTSFLTAALLVVSTGAAAQTPAPPAPAPPPAFGIEDNSFLVEEAFNQDKGIFQNIFVFSRSHTGSWNASFTQEWPLGGQRHQVSFTIPYARENGTGDVGDVFLNYRLQVWTGDDRRPAFSPRLSWTRHGWQANLPLSKRFNRLYVHANAGSTWLHDASEGWGSTPFVAGSAMVAVRPMLNLMLEAYSEWRPNGAGAHDRAVTISPGVRGGWNVGDAQFVLGLAAPITRGAVRDHGVLGYVSYELPFSKNR